MGRQSTVAAIAAYLQQPTQFSGAIPSLNAVFAYPPKLIQGQDFYNNLPAGTASGAFMYIALEHQTEKRIALGGAHSGNKWRQYQATLVCFMRYVGPTLEQALSDVDAFIDGLTTFIQADRNLGTAPAPGNEILPGMIFQAGEGGDHGGEDLVVDVMLPKVINQGTTVTFFTVAMQVAEILQT